MQFRRCAVRLLPLVFALAGSAAFAATPTVTVSPTGNHPRGTTKVSGTGFGASENVDIYFDTADEALATADASGNFAPHTIPVPATALPGDHWVTAIGRTTITGGQHSFLVRTRWPSLGFNAAGLRYNSYENVIDPSNIRNLDVAWSAKTTDHIISSPAIAQVGSVYNPYAFVGSDDNNLYAFDSTGALVWKEPAGDLVDSSPAVSGNSVYVGSEDGKLYAFNAKDGTPAWPAPATTGGDIHSSPTIANGIVYVASADGNLYAFHASDGTPAWPMPAPIGGDGHTSATVADGMVYIAGGNLMYAFDALTGDYIWLPPFQSAGGIIGNPAAVGGTLYFGSFAGVYALDAKTGAEKWLASIGRNGANTSPAVANGIVYTGAADNKLYALRADDGHTLWTANLSDIATSPAVANGVVYIGVGAEPRKPGIEAFKAGGCGASVCPPLWSAIMGNIVRNSSPAISDGMVYIGATDGRLYAYALNSGDNPAYTFRKNAQPPSFASLHPDIRLKPSRY